MGIRKTPKKKVTKTKDSTLHSQEIKNKKGERKKKVDTDKISIFRSLRFRLIMIVMVPVCFLIIAGAIAYNKSSTGLVDNYKDSSKQTLNMASEYFQFEFATSLGSCTNYTYETEFQAYGQGVYIENPTTADSMNTKYVSTFQKCLTNANYVSNVYYLTSDKIAAITTSFVDTEGLYEKYLETNEGKIAAENEGKTCYFGNKTDFDTDLGLANKSYSVRMVQKMSGVRAFLIVDMKTSGIQDILDKINLGEGSITALITQDGTEVYSTTSEEVKSALFETDFYKTAIEQEDAQPIEVSYNGSQYLFVCNKIGTTGASVCGLIPISNVNESAVDIRNVTIFLVIIASVIAILFGTFIATGINRTIRDMIGQIGKAAKGDLTVQVKTKRKDEFSILAKELTMMISNMKNLILKVDSISSNLTNAATDVTDSSGSFVQSADHIKTAASEIEEGVTQQAEDAIECLNQMDTLSGKIELLNQNTTKITDIINSTGKTIDQGMSYMDTMNEKARSTTEITGSVISTIESLEEKSNNISNIVNVINDISEQTNLLSLNASIEAARAGEAGRGFAVVADEIRKLAEMSLSSANKINAIIEEIMVNTKVAVKTAKDAEIIVQEQASAVRDTTSSFEEIDKQVEYLMEHIKEVLSNVSEMEQSRVNTLGAVENISAVSEESASSSSTVTEAASEQFVMVKKLDDMAQKLSEYAKDLESAVNVFTIK